mmetsp:Transcript_6266/g.16986  ORF Transcript_6266/g.16986 Transcript_6266/m.16986 type:complete len:331 (+) Transcript_6266:93-1085(+)
MRVQIGRLIAQKAQCGQSLEVRLTTSMNVHGRTVVDGKSQREGEGDGVTETRLDSLARAASTLRWTGAVPPPANLHGPLEGQASPAPRGTSAAASEGHGSGASGSRGKGQGSGRQRGGCQVNSERALRNSSLANAQDCPLTAVGDDLDFLRQPDRVQLFQIWQSSQDGLLVSSLILCVAYGVHCVPLQVDCMKRSEAGQVLHFGQVLHLAIVHPQLLQLRQFRQRSNSLDRILSEVELLEPCQERQLLWKVRQIVVPKVEMGEARTIMEQCGIPCFQPVVLHAQVSQRGQRRQCHGDYLVPAEPELLQIGKLTYLGRDLANSIGAQFEHL